MVGSDIWQSINTVQLLGSQRRHRRILNKHFLAVLLFYKLSSDVILLVLLNPAGNGVFFFAGTNIFKGWAFCAVKRCLIRVANIARSTDIAY